jgi:electron transport complex protein RnfG
MKEIVRMIVVLSLISTVCGLALSGYRQATAERIENQVLTYVQGPKVKLVLKGAENDLIADRKKISVQGQEILLFLGKREGEPWAIAYETEGKGFGGTITVMTGYDIRVNNFTGIQIVSHKETPGVGSRVADEQFTGQFGGLHLDLQFEGEGCPGEIDALSGATYSSEGVCEAIRKSLALYPEVLKELGLRS